VALGLHELTTNAVKHGALRGGEGRLDVRWAAAPDERGRQILTLDWVETGVEMPQRQAPAGYGRELIERALAFTLQAKTELLFGLNGVSCRLEIPLSPLAGAR